MKSVALVLLLLFLRGQRNILNAQQVKPPVPCGATPAASQLRWQQMEYYMFIHFGPNTFTNREWGLGNEDPKLFNPAQLDCRQWARTAQLAGMKGIIITAKHHDGFCLFPSRYSTHTVRESNWKNGKGDVLKELSAACKEYGLKFGVYLSPWDRHHPSYGTAAYNEVFAKMLEEVHTQYGDIFEQWFDGANGEGPTGKRQVYDWSLFEQVVFKYHPQAIIFSDKGPGCRWIGNEQGMAGQTNWSTLHADHYHPGQGGIEKILNSGEEDGANWVPGECDVSIRPGWFYSPNTDGKVKSLRQLVDIYYSSVGRNANLLLNVPVDRRGLIPSEDSARLMEFGHWIRKSFAHNLARGARVVTSNTRGRHPKFSGGQLVDGQFASYWATDDSVRQATITLHFAHPVCFDQVVLQEYIPLGQRVKSFVVESWDGKKFEPLVQATTIGYKRILQVPAQHTRAVRIRILDAKACPVLSELQLYLAAPLVLHGAMKK